MFLWGEGMRFDSGGASNVEGQIHVSVLRSGDDLVSPRQIHSNRFHVDGKFIPDL